MRRGGPDTETENKTPASEREPDELTIVPPLPQPEGPRVLAQDVRDVADAIAAGCRDIDQQRDVDTLRRAAWEMEREGPRVTLREIELAFMRAFNSTHMLQSAHAPCNEIRRKMLADLGRLFV